MRLVNGHLNLPRLRIGRKHGVGDRSGRGLDWAPDGKALQFTLLHNGASNIWEQPLTGGPLKQVTNFTSDFIFDFKWTRDGKTLLISRGTVNRDVILLSNFR